MITSKLTSKAQTTIPSRCELHWAWLKGRAGLHDRGRPRGVDQGAATAVRKGDPLDDPFATFWEWDTKEDAEDFADL